MILFLYTGRVECHTDDQIASLYALARRYEINGLKKLLLPNIFWLKLLIARPINMGRFDHAHMEENQDLNTIGQIYQEAMFQLASFQSCFKELAKRMYDLPDRSFQRYSFPEPIHPDFLSWTTP
jgi:hypothetical protein